MGSACEYSNELWGSIKCGEFLDQLRTCQLLKKDSALLGKYISMFILVQSLDIYFLEIKFEGNIEVKNLSLRNVNFSFIVESFLESFLNLVAAVIYKWCPLPYRTDWHTQVYKVHTFVFATLLKCRNYVQPLLTYVHLIQSMCVHRYKIR